MPNESSCSAGHGRRTRHQAAHGRAARGVGADPEDGDAARDEVVAALQMPVCWVSADSGGAQLPCTKQLQSDSLSPQPPTCMASANPELGKSRVHFW